MLSWVPPHHAYGGVRGRRREGAILVQLMNQWRSRRAKWSSVFAAYDGTNAFACGDPRRIAFTACAHAPAAAHLRHAPPITVAAKLKAAPRRGGVQLGIKSRHPAGRAFGAPTA